MFTFAVDPEQSSLVLVHWPGPWVDDAFRDALVALRRLVSVQRAVRIVIVTRDGAPTPTRQQRRDFVSALAGGDSLVAMVTGAPAHRGALTALSLVSPSLRGRLHASSTFEGACRWLAERTGQDMSAMEHLLAAAEANSLEASAAAR